MTCLEKETCSDGFLLCLLETWQDRAQGAIAFQGKLFDGGRETASVRHAGKPGDAGPPVAQLLKLLYHVIRPPHVLAVYGLGWMELIQKSKPEILPRLRILDLYSTAIALSNELRPRSSTADIARVYGVGHQEGESLFFSSTVEHILWAVVSRASERGMNWPQLLSAADAARKQADFTHCAFDENTLDSLPERPGVYAMYDAQGSILYIGKSACLKRRLGEYFQPTAELPPKLAAIRQRIHHFDFTLVGSELEALLLEHRLIGEHSPILNVQTRVAEGRSRYAAPFLPVALIERSAKPGHASIFFFGGPGHALQITFKPGGKPPASLAGIIRHFITGEKSPKANRALRDWGTEGQEICRRYFMRHRDRLHWMELPASPLDSTWIRRLMTIARSLLNEPPPPGEYRDIISNQS
jgi:hypothetical protein